MKKTTKYIIWTILILSIILWYAYLTNKVRITEAKNDMLINEMNTPTELESLIITKGHKRNERIENRKQIETLEAKNQTIREEEYEINNKIKEITGLE